MFTHDRALSRLLFPSGPYSENNATNWPPPPSLFDATNPVRWQNKAERFQIAINILICSKIYLSQALHDTRVPAYWNNKHVSPKKTVRKQNSTRFMDHEATQQRTGNMFIWWGQFIISWTYTNHRSGHWTEKNAK